MSAITATRTVTPASIRSAPINRPSSFESPVQATRRLAVAADRRRQRTTTIVSAALVGVGSVGTLAFAALMVTFR